jgi:alpha-ketoglutarate-dependent taurine dioxygenase
MGGLDIGQAQCTLAEERQRLVVALEHVIGEARQPGRKDQWLEGVETNVCLFVAKITGVELGRPIDEATRRAIEHAMDQYAVCVLTGQHLEDEELIAFSRLYGSLEAAPHVGRNAGAAGRKRRIPDRQIWDISNLDENGSIRGDQDARSSLLSTTQLWHTDLSFRQGSATWSILHAKVIPPAGGDTEFADTRAAYDALPDAMKRTLAGLVAEHSLWHSSAKRGYVPTDENESHTRRRDTTRCADIPVRGGTRSMSPRTHRTSSAYRSRRGRRCSPS